ncbi:site-specific integrase [Bordetella sp. 15P40C-2]|uniref:site-specific integrase n=1 Tax=Bordetella sp. 15P40C-2 TaxID=2572246 RepID=UPI001329572D|nr:site-specific integrase [Bordetella sp. 15P40C-2]MVW72777.1 tyrosine-type recombinase/integrase [Bordetella sp. 15P40C-2]
MYPLIRFGLLACNPCNDVREIALRNTALNLTEVAHRKPSINDDTIVSSLVGDDGTTHVLSRFGDTNWDLTPYFEQPNVPESMKTICWPTDLPDSLLADSKAAFFAWFKEGRPGYGGANARTLVVSAINARRLLRWLRDQAIEAFDQIRPLHLARYLQDSRAEKHVRARGIMTRFEIIDLAWTFRDKLARPLRFPPWGDMSLSVFCGMTGNASNVSRAGVGITPVIPRRDQERLFTHCEAQLANADQLLTMRDAGEIGASSEPMRDLRDACLYLLSISSGMRNEEVIGLNVGCGRTEVKDGLEYSWLASIEHKTRKGRVEYLVPSMALKVVSVLERYSQPLREALQAEIRDMEASISNAQPKERGVFMKRLMQARRDVNRLFLGIIMGKFNQISALSVVASRVAFRRLATRAGVAWGLSPHQCRRTYARMVVESQMGRQSLVFLKWQLKHSSISMTQLYASNPAQDPALYEDILAEYFDIKKDLLDRWSTSGTPLSGGAGRKIVEMRATAVSSRKRLVEHTAAQIHIRATGHGWCIAQESGCGGAGLYESVRCVDCKNGVIDNDFKEVWQGIYGQHKELLALDDLGPVANDRIRRDLALAAKVLADLGAQNDEAQHLAVGKEIGYERNT